jgi:hexosaminidase
MIQVIPAPVKISVSPGQFRLTATTRIVHTAATGSHAQYLASKLAPATGFTLPLHPSESPSSAEINSIELTIGTPDVHSLAAEGYLLQIIPERIIIHGKDAAGCFYGIQTLRQLLPAEIESAVPLSEITWTVPCVDILDYPRFSWRGFMLDEVRHFFGKVFTKRMIDLMALYKLNKLHWHLTDDEGWRIESKRFPKLNSIGARRLIAKKWKEFPNLNHPQWYGGYYTVEEIHDILEYAHQHYIEVIPEIEMPGHATAPLVAYPEFSCSNPPPIVQTIGMGKTRQAYCAGKPATYHFLREVLDEVMTIFSGNKIHIGGDELPKERWEACSTCQQFMKDHAIPNLDMLQVHFAAENIKYLNSRGKTVLGWFDFPVDRLLDQGIDNNLLYFQFWVGSEQKMIDFVKKGGKAVVSNHRFVYLDYTYYRTNLKKAYTFDPIPATLEPQYHTQVLGIECPIWTERVPNYYRMDYQVFPRFCAYAETAWTPADKKDYKSFTNRLRELYKRFDILAVYAAPLDEAMGTLISRFKPRSWHAI